ncbi:MAG: hypothetical protein L6R39_005137 [Caloplaca ligustica]|nr:MAG: hypothetical protein L6R39_005137 [Caloplaca ligustica]
MALPDGSRLAIAQLVFYLPALVLSIVVNLRHGFRRELGWFFLILVAVVRLIGNSMEIAGNSERNIRLLIGAAVLNGVGLSPLLLAMVALLKRVNKDLLRGTLVTVLNLARLPILVALILTAYGSSQLYGQASPSTYKSGEDIARAGIIILLVTFGLMVLITATTYMHLRHIRFGENTILYAVTASIPFLLLWLIYSTLVYFDTHNNTFGLTRGNIWARSFMSVLPEWITVMLYIAGGLVAPDVASKEVKDPEMSASGYNPESGPRAARPG